MPQAMKCSSSFSIAEYDCNTILKVRGGFDRWQLFLRFYLNQDGRIIHIQDIS